MEPQTPMTNKIVTVSVLIEPGGFIFQYAFLDGVEIEFRCIFSKFVHFYFIA